MAAEVRPDSGTRPDQPRTNFPPPAPFMARIKKLLPTPWRGGHVAAAPSLSFGHGLPMCWPVATVRAVRLGAVVGCGARGEQLMDWMPLSRRAMLVLSLHRGRGAAPLRRRTGSAGKARVALQQHLHLRRHRQRQHDVRPEQALLHRKQHEALGPGRADGRLHPLHDARASPIRRRSSASPRSASAAAAPSSYLQRLAARHRHPRHRARQGRGRSRQEILQLPGDRAAAHRGVRRPGVPAEATPTSGTSS